MRARFDRMDSNHDGQVTLEELMHEMSLLEEWKELKQEQEEEQKHKQDQAAATAAAAARAREDAQYARKQQRACPAREGNEGKVM